MSISFHTIDQNYFKPVSTTFSETVDDSEEFLLIDTVEQVAQSSIHAQTKSEQQTTLQDKQLSQVATKSTKLPSLPYMFRRTGSWEAMQYGDDRGLQIEGPDSDGDLLIRYQRESTCICTCDEGIYTIQIRSGKIHTQFISA